jgi:hypothetical protein
MATAGELLSWAALGGLGAVGLTTILRNAPVVRGWVQEAKKPWACNVCMPLYTSAAMIAVPIWRTGDWSYAAAFPAAYALGYIGLEQMSRPPGPPPVFELPEDSS